jgi:hypothetical protein
MKNSGSVLTPTWNRTEDNTTAVYCMLLAYFCPYVGELQTTEFDLAIDIEPTNL